MHSNGILVAALLAVLPLGGLPRPVQAARLLTATVVVDGETILQTKFSDDSNPHRERVWRYLAEPPFWAEEAHVPVDDVALRAELVGDVVVRIAHTGDAIVEAKSDRVTLVRDDAGSDRWYLPADDVERLAAANGIGAVSMFHLSEGEYWRTILVGVGIAVFVVAGLLVVRFRSGVTPAPMDVSGSDRVR